MKVNFKTISKEEEKMLWDIREEFVNGWVEEGCYDDKKDKPYAVICYECIQGRGYEGLPKITEYGKKFLISKVSEWIQKYHPLYINKKITDAYFDIEDIDDVEDIKDITSISLSYFDGEYDDIDINYEPDGGYAMIHYGKPDFNKHKIPINIKRAICMLTKNSSYSEEDYQKMYIMRQSKFTYKQIGLEFGVTVEAIRQKISRINRFASRFSC